MSWDPCGEEFAIAKIRGENKRFFRGPNERKSLVILRAFFLSIAGLLPFKCVQCTHISPRTKRSGNAATI